MSDAESEYTYIEEEEDDDYDDDLTESEEPERYGDWEVRRFEWRASGVLGVP